VKDNDNERRVDYISDLHIDFHVRYGSSKAKRKRQTQAYIDRLVPTEPSDILIIAGDTSHYNTQTTDVLVALQRHYRHIILVYGNHDMYMTSESQRVEYQSSKNRIEDLKARCEELGVYLLDGDAVELGGIRIGGLAGWYNLPTKEDRDHWSYFMNDSNYIYSGVERKPIPIYQYGSVRAEWDTQDFYAHQLGKLEGLRGKNLDILVTHVGQVLPPPLAIQKQFRGDASNIFYYVDNLSKVEATGCKYYIYGHTHGGQDYKAGNINVLCNPKGYPGENPHVGIKTLTL
jgi:predicted MPP superfamily phosphohydrolase